PPWPSRRSCRPSPRYVMFARLRKWFPVSEGFQSYPGHVLVLIIRGVFGALLIGIATGVLYFYADRNELTAGVLSFLLILAVGGVIVLLDAVPKNKQITTISAIFFGLLMGSLLAYLFWKALEPLIGPYIDGRAVQWVELLVTLLSCYICVSMLIQTKE